MCMTFGVGVGDGVGDGVGGGGGGGGGGAVHPTLICPEANIMSLFVVDAAADHRESGCCVFAGSHRTWPGFQ